MKASSQTIRRRLVLGVLCAFIAVAGAGWYAWRWYTTPPDPPSVRLEGADAVVAEAIESARREVMQNKRSGQAWGHFGQVLLAHGYDPASDICFAQAARLDTKDPRWPYLLGARVLRTSPVDALPLLRDAVARAETADGDNDAPRFRLAEVLLQVGALDEAASHLDRLAANDPDNARLQYDFGLLAVARQNDALAIQHFTRASESRFARKKADAQLAALYQRQGDPSAEEFSRRAQGLPPDASWPDPYMNECMRLEVGKQSRLLVAEQLEQEGRAAEAARHFRDIALDFPEDRPLIAEGVSLCKLGRYDEAEPIFRRVLQQSPDLAQAHYNLGIALFFQGDRLVHQSPDDREGALAKFREAAERLARTTEMKPDHALAYVYLGLALREIGRRDEAITALRMAVHCRPEMIEPHLHLGEVLAEAEQKDEAIASLERAVTLSSDSDPRARQALERVRAGDKQLKK